MQQTPDARHHQPPQAIDVHDKRRVGGRVRAVVGRGPVLNASFPLLLLRARDASSYIKSLTRLRPIRHKQDTPPSRHISRSRLHARPAPPRLRPPQSRYTHDICHRLRTRYKVLMGPSSRTSIRR
jgi:hypothetical protein